tara:strand:+ start:22958 stop:23389 length:432 start_codon:yes stop_codon:yes gene_type:complete
MKLVKRNNGAFPSIWDSFYNDDFFSVPDMLKPGTTAPAINIRNNEDDFLVEMAIPGMKKEDFKIDLDNNVLTISSEEKSEQEETQDNYTRKEFNYSSFKRSFTLPETVDGDKIEAKYEAGVLGITIPKKEEAKPKPPRAIEIA